MTPDLAVRRFESRDQAEVWNLHRTATSGAEAFEDDEYFGDLNDIQTRYIDAGGEFLVGVVGERVVAMGGLLPRGGGVAEILRMRVDPVYQRMGFAAAVLRSLEERARERGFGTLVLQTTVVQSAAQHFYESQGYVETGRGTDDGYAVIRYQKTIG